MKTALVVVLMIVTVLPMAALVLGFMAPSMEHCLSALGVFVLGIIATVITTSFDGDDGHGYRS